MFCPVCGGEYIKGITVCSTCNVALVHEPPIEEPPEFLKLVTVYETGDPALIAFIKSILESEGIRYFMKGEGLQDLFALGRLGPGFNPAVGPVEIQVDEKDVEKANSILSDLEQAESALPETDASDEADAVDESEEDQEESHVGKPSRKGFLMGMTIGILISALAAFAYYYHDRHFTGTMEYDYNKDLRVDISFTYEDGMLVSTKQDRNFDGKMDEWLFYKDEIADRGEYDNNFDGIAETTAFFKNGILSQVRIDTNLDKKPDIIESYTNGVLSEQLWYHETSDKLWKKATFFGGIIKEEYIDKDYDGVFDVKITYNSAGRAVETDPLHY